MESDVFFSRTLQEAARVPVCEKRRSTLHDAIPFPGLIVQKLSHPKRGTAGYPSRVWDGGFPGGSVGNRPVPTQETRVSSPARDDPTLLQSHEAHRPRRRNPCSRSWPLRALSPHPAAAEAHVPQCPRSPRGTTATRSPDTQPQSGPLLRGERTARTAVKTRHTPTEIRDVPRFESNTGSRMGRRRPIPRPIPREARRLRGR